MTISTYQIRNVLRIYGNQLKRRSTLLDSGVEPVKPSADFVDISVEARRRQVLNQLSQQLISQVKEDSSIQKVYKKNLSNRHMSGDMDQ